MSQKTTVLAIDFGTKRIGLAITHATLAVPLTVIEYDDIQQAVEQIKKICHDYSVSRIVLGLSENIMAKKTHDFGLILEKEIQLPVNYVDETLSSSEVRNKFKQRNKGLGGEPIDHYAAALILEEWLDSSIQ